MTEITTGTVLIFKVSLIFSCLAMAKMVISPQYNFYTSWHSKTIQRTNRSVPCDRQSITLNQALHLTAFSPMNSNNSTPCTHPIWNWINWLGFPVLLLLALNCLEPSDRQVTPIPENISEHQGDR